MRRCAIKRTAPSISYGPESSKTITVDGVSATNYLEGCFSARSSSNGAITVVPTRPARCSAYLSAATSLGVTMGLLLPQLERS
jgi:hypothetical protein